MPIFARLAKRIQTPFNELDKANVNSHNKDVIFIFHAFLILKYLNVFPKKITDFFSQSMVQPLYYY